MHHFNYTFNIFYFITSLGNRIDKTWLGEYRLVGYTLAGLAFVYGLKKTFFSYVIYSHCSIWLYFVWGIELFLLVYTFHKWDGPGMWRGMFVCMSICVCTREDATDRN